MSEAKITSDGWKPIESAPRYKDVIVYRSDTGVFMGRYDSIIDWVVDPESEEGNEYDEETLHKEDWWYYHAFGVTRLEGDMAPTHWREFPESPENAEAPE